MAFAPTNAGTLLTANTTPVKANITGDTFLIHNTGANTVYVLTLDTGSASVADATCTPVFAGGIVTFDAGGAVAVSVYSTASNTFKLVLGSGDYLAFYAASSGGGGGGGGAVTIADGSDASEGSTTDTAATAGGTGTVQSKLRLMTTQLNTIGTNTTGLATSSAQTTGNNSLATLVTNTTGGLTTATPGTTNIVAPITGQNGIAGGAGVTTANTTRVTIASDSATLNVTSTAPSNASTSGNISALNANLASGTATTNSTVALTSMNGVGSVGIQVTGTFVATLIVQITLDGANWQTLAQDFADATGNYAANITTTGTYKVSGQACAQLRVTCSAYTSGTAVVTLMSSTSALSSVGFVQSQSINQLGGSTALTIPSPVGATGNALVVGVAGTTTTTIIAGAAVNTTSGTSAALTDTTGSGISGTLVVNMTSLTLGSSTGVDMILQISYDGGTVSYNDIWHVERITATGQYYIPHINLPGRVRMKWLNSVAATAAVATVTLTRVNGPATMVQRQYFDRTAAVLAGTPQGSTTSTYDMAGCKIITASITLGTATGPATYQLQNSSDNSNWTNVGTATLAVASATTDLVYTTNTKRYVRVIVTSASSSQTGTLIAITGTS